jgi:phosphatidylglycerol:prolipoprotein diacylglycerol transferase
MIPVLLEIGPITLTSFGLMVLVGFLVPTLLLRTEFRREGLDPDLAIGVAIAAFLGGFVGARLFYMFERWDHFIAHPADYIFTGIGLVWYGGLLGGAFAVIWYVRRRGISAVLVADLLAPSLALGQMFGRIGCLLSGDGDYGPVTDVPWAMSFPRGLVPTDELVHPTPVYDAFILFTIFLVLWRLRRKDLPPGFRISLYLLLMGAGRFLTEFYRRTPEVFAGLTVAQLVSAGLVVVGTTFLLVSTSGAPDTGSGPS